MKLIDQIKQDLAELQRNRTSVKIHLSWDAAKKLTMDPPWKDIDLVTSNLSDTLLGCALETHIDQAQAYVFEDVHGRQISGSGSALTRL
jgi:hypothetical protein